MVSVPVLGPVVLGVKVTLIRQDNSGATLVPQVEVSEKSPLLIEICEIVRRLVVLKLFIATVFTLLGLPTVCGGNTRLVLEAGEQSRVERTKGGSGC